MKQMLLPLDGFKSEYRIADYIVCSCNCLAYNIAMMCGSWYNNRIIVSGESGCGKTHLALIICEKFRGIYINWGEISKVSDCFLNAQECGVLVIDNIICHDLESERMLFHIVNTFNERKQNLVLIFGSEQVFLLPDLESRIKSTVTAEIGCIDENFLRIVVMKQLSDKQIIIKNEVFEYLVKNMRRNFTYIKKMIDYIDKYSLELSSEISTSFVKKIFTLLNKPQ